MRAVITYYLKCQLALLAIFQIDDDFFGFRQRRSIAYPDVQSGPFHN